MKSMSSEFCCVTAAPMSEDESSQLADALAAIADPVRLRILSMVASAEGGELCACDIPAAVGRSQPTVSHHLGRLRTARLVANRRDGKQVFYSLNDELVSQPAETCELAIEAGALELRIREPVGNGNHALEPVATV